MNRLQTSGAWIALLLGLVTFRAAAQAPIDLCVRKATFPVPAAAGPFDYRNQRNAIRTTEINHFTPNVENLVRGNTGTLAGEFSFVLHAYPNHHRALAALIRWGERDRSLQPADLDYSIDCYFERALHFRPDDVIARMLYAEQLGGTKRLEEALAQLERVKIASPDNPMTQYNVGLLYFQFGRYKDALAQAHKAAALGMPRTELMEKLKSKGQWADPQPAIDTLAPAASKPAS